MKTLFAVKNSTGETWPAFGMGRLGSVLQYDGINSDVPLYALTKPDGEDGIYVVNGAAPLANTSEGTGVHYIDAQFVLVKSSDNSNVGVSVGAINGEWTAGSGTGNGGQFIAVDVKNSSNVIPVIHRGGGVTSASPSCNTVRFQILVADTLTRTALCVITARPYGCGVGDIPGTVIEGQAIEVCDPGGCFFNEPNPPLVGREGWASYMMPIAGSTWCQQNVYYGMQPEWEVFSLCCAVDSCFL